MSAVIRKQGFFEKVAKNAGVIYRYHFVKHGPRRKVMFKNMWEKELAPPKLSELPQIKQDLVLLEKTMLNGAYRELPLKEFLAYGLVCLEVIFWFFVGEQIGRWNIGGYVVPATYKDPAAVKYMAKWVPEDKTVLK